MRQFKLYLILFVFITIISSGCINSSDLSIPSTKEVIETSNSKFLNDDPNNSNAHYNIESFALNIIPTYFSEPYIEVNGNYPFFTEEDNSTTSFESYSTLDESGRCGAAFANISKDIMPKEERGQIGQIKPSGWHLIKYDIVDGKYLYNRCHLIGYQLTAENANEKNLITGTRYLNVQGMLPFENMVANYIKETSNHVLYRVTPVFEGNNLIAAGVLMEAKSVEDDGTGICYNVFVYNVQPGIKIDYATGDSRLSKIPDSKETTAVSTDYILNTNSMKYHKPECSSVNKIKEENQKKYNGNYEVLVLEGYTPCGTCKP